jgi:hypothetical protein
MVVHDPRRNREREEEDKYTTFQFRVTNELLSKFKLMAEGDHRSAANAIKMLMADYVRKMSGRVIDPGMDEETPTPTKNEAGE